MWEAKLQISSAFDFDQLFQYPFACSWLSFGYLDAYMEKHTTFVSAGCLPKRKSLELHFLTTNIQSQFSFN